MIDAAKGTVVTVGISGTCPYGLGACWGGAHEALRRLEGVNAVDPLPDVASATATVFLEDGRLPAVDRWDEQFAQMAHGSYQLRGVEVSLKGTVEARDGEHFLRASGERPSVVLAALGPLDKIQWQRQAGAPAVSAPDEAAAYHRLAAESAHAGEPIIVTGPLTWSGGGYRMLVRSFEVGGRRPGRPACI